MDEIQQMKKDYSDALKILDFKALLNLADVLLAMNLALETIPVLPEASFAASHLERLKKDVNDLREAVELIDR